MASSSPSRDRPAPGSLSAYVLASYKVLHFYFTHVTRFGDIHDDLPSGKLVENIRDTPILLMSPSADEIRRGNRKSENVGVQKNQLRIPLRAAFRQNFNSNYESLQKDLRLLLPARPFESILVQAFAVRALWAVVVWVLVARGRSSGGVVEGSTRTAFDPTPYVVLTFGLAQFVVAPMSFVVCIMRFGTNMGDAVLHYLVAVFVGLVLAPLVRAALSFGVVQLFGFPLLSYFTIKLGLNFTITFLATDFLLNSLVYWHTSERFGIRRLLKHVFYGTFNTKTYFLVVLGVLQNVEIDLVNVLLVGMISLWLERRHFLPKVLRLVKIPCFHVAFYVEHRVGHLPGVYPQAHKMHHYLHDTTPFDAHIYGSGMNEEFFWILVETLPCLLCAGSGSFFNTTSSFVVPYFLNARTLYDSWTNKGGHMRTAADRQGGFGDFDGDNFHADHHTRHNTNFGSSTSCFLDFYFGTVHESVRGSIGRRYRIEGSFAEEGKEVLAQERDDGRGGTNHGSVEGRRGGGEDGHPPPSSLTLTRRRAGDVPPSSGRVTGGPHCVVLVVEECPVGESNRSAKS